MARDDLHFRLRIPEDLKKMIEASAADRHRSMTAEIVARLEFSFISAAELARLDEELRTAEDQAKTLRLKRDELAFKERERAQEVDALKEELHQARKTLELLAVDVPEGLRERVAYSAKRNRRSLQAEITQALEQFYPPAPSVYDVLEKVHAAIELSERAGDYPYRQALVEALDEFSERLSSGLEQDQFRSTTLRPSAVRQEEVLDRLARWERAKKYGVEQSDLERELARGLLRRRSRNNVKSALEEFKKGNTRMGLHLLMLDGIKFADPEAAYRAIEADLLAYYHEKWGDPYVPWSSLPHED
ncbi:Arc family DNA-binding protein [Mesorhizobium sp.]|nr:Arc family DNA-binding protein [Mesorhizobium sp.]